MAQNKDTDQIDEVTDRLLAMLNVTPPTPLGDALRKLADVVDRAPDLISMKKNPTVPAQLDVLMSSAREVEAVGAALDVEPTRWVSRRLTSRYTRVNVTVMDLVTLHVFAPDNLEEQAS